MIEQKDYQFYMDAAKEWAATYSEDPATKVGCVFVDAVGNIFGQGANRFPCGMKKSYTSTARPLKYSMILHAEMVALTGVIFSDGYPTESDTVFVTHAPCVNCLKHLINANVRTIIYEDVEAAKRITSDVDKEAIRLIIEGSGAVVQSMDGKSFLEELK